MVKDCYLLGDEVAVTPIKSISNTILIDSWYCKYMANKVLRERVFFSQLTIRIYRKNIWRTIEEAFEAYTEIESVCSIELHFLRCVRVV